ncbi:hypothetical protein [Bdellovibrio bacteriovorus]|uniref:hypothetical protein n=1 Tax=Bdellovibrio bacteriovorus TaxID=959 RepID=UPI00045C09EC|nr:hypothetical protein [Bdellovibrio bacteriovorus]AHZ84033.1 hypothetical protein EP01_03630 [Bdellovibrio bacteriovorus]BEV67916.1 hypothetical protein Bb109J_c1336 [Bdellovibrio bacteriovorus]
MKTIITAMVAFILLGASAGFAKQRTVRKVQEVNFGDMNLKGTIRNPDGAYLVQKRGIKFMPLYDVQKDMDGRIRESALYLNN